MNDKEKSEAVAKILDTFFLPNTTRDMSQSQTIYIDRVAVYVQSATSVAVYGNQSSWTLYATTARPTNPRMEFQFSGVSVEMSTWEKDLYDGLRQGLEERGFISTYGPQVYRWTV